MQTYSSSLQAAAEIPDDPDTVLAKQQQAAIPPKKPWYQITANVQGQGGTTKLITKNFIAIDDAALDDPKNPGNAQATADLNAAFNVYMLLTDQSSGCSNAPKPAPTGSTTAHAANPSTTHAAAPPPSGAAGIISGPIQIQAQCGPQTFDQYLSTVSQTASTLNFNSKVELLSLLGDDLGNLYNNNAQNQITPLPTVFQALITNAANAGVCRDIHTFLAVTAKNLGFQDAGVTGLDWNNGSETTSHTIAQFKDPSNGKYVFINYGNVYEVNSTNMSEAAQMGAQVANPYTTAVETQTVDNNGNGRLHLDNTPRTQAIENTINQASNMDGPHLSISVGTLNNSVSAQTRLIGNNQNRVGVFGVAEDNHQGGDPVQFGASGVRVDVNRNIQTSQNTNVNLNGSGTGGVLDVHDTGVTGNSRNSALLYGNANAQAAFNFQHSGNTGQIGVSDHAQAAKYLGSGNGVSISYQEISISALDNPTKNIQVHFKDTSFTAVTTEQNIAPTLHHSGDALGVQVTHQFDNGKVTVTNDTTGHYFAGGGIGINDAATLTANTQKHGDFSLGADCGTNINPGNDPFNSYPTTCHVDASYDKALGNYDLQGNVQVSTGHNTFVGMQGDDPALTQPGFAVQPSGVTFGITLTRKPKQ
jgi:hypothetical protein